MSFTLNVFAENMYLLQSNSIISSVCNDFSKAKTFFDILDPKKTLGSINEREFKVLCSHPLQIFAAMNAVQDAVIEEGNYLQNTKPGSWAWAT